MVLTGRRWRVLVSGATRHWRVPPVRWPANQQPTPQQGTCKRTHTAAWAHVRGHGHVGLCTQACVHAHTRTHCLYALFSVCSLTLAHAYTYIHVLVPCLALSEHRRARFIPLNTRAHTHPHLQEFHQSPVLAVRGGLWSEGGWAPTSVMRKNPAHIIPRIRELESRGCHCRHDVPGQPRCPTPVWANGPTLASAHVQPRLTSCK